MSLSTKAGSRFLLQNISFEVFYGDRIALIGASGAGKTSLLRLLNRLEEPSEGTIYLEGSAIRQIPVFSLRQQVMLVPQEPKLLGMTVERALVYPLILQKVPPAQIQQRLESWTAQLRIPADWLERDELRLSVGERQLVAITRALVTKPKLLLLDEPTSALDVGRAELVFKALTQHGQITTITVTHQLDLARQFCNRILYVDRGKLIWDRDVEAVDWDQLRQTLIQQEQLTATEWN